ncbi:uncharacterized protein LOC144100470 isoform X2 [Amblyomma americanum]
MLFGFLLFVIVSSGILTSGEVSDSEDSGGLGQSEGEDSSVRYGPPRQTDATTAAPRTVSTVVSTGGQNPPVTTTSPILPSTTLSPPPVTSASAPTISTVNTTPTISSSSSSTPHTLPTTTPSQSTPSTASQTTATDPTSYLNKPPTNSSLICTVTCSRPIAVPNDGVCDFMLFDSLYLCGGEVAAQSLPKSLQSFVALAAASRNTQYGCSVDALAVEDFVGDLKKTQAKAWVEENLLKNKVYHWGVMNVHKVYLEGNEGMLKIALEALKEAVTFSRPLAHQRQIAPYTFLGSYGGCQTIGQEVKSVFTPDAIVILGHMSFQPYKISREISNFKCIILPPNIYQIPAGVRHLVPYAHTYYEGCRVAECLRIQDKLQVPIGVSVTLKGLWWVPHTDDEMSAPSEIGSYAVYKECDLRSFEQDSIPDLQPDKHKLLQECATRPGCSNDDHVRQKTWFQTDLHFRQPSDIHAKDLRRQVQPD